MASFLSNPQPDPLDLEIEPGFPVRNLRTPEECAAALSKLDHDIEKILAQIARAEASPDETERGWRTRAQGAIRWKKRIKTAIANYATTLRAPSPARLANDDRRQAILETIAEEIGEAEFQRMVQVARQRYPDLWPVAS